MKTNRMRVGLLTLFTLLASVPVQSAVVLVQPAVADAVVRSSAEKKNFGSEPALELKTSTFGGVSEAYVRFEIPEFAQFSDKVVFRIFGQLGSPGAAQVVVRSIGDTNWDETTLAWRW